MFFIDKLRVFESFAGIGAVSKALTNLKIDYDLVGFSEIDKYSIKSFCAIHNVDPVLNYGDINNINEKDLPDFDLYTFGSPCFVKGTLVLTDKGYKKIEDINKNDLVITHTNSYKRVLKPMVNFTEDLYKVKTNCSEDILTTAEHPFYVREYNRFMFSNPKWVKAKDLLSSKYYVGVAINQNSTIPKISDEIDKISHMPNFWFLVGLFVGDEDFNNEDEHIQMTFENKLYFLNKDVINSVIDLPIELLKEFLNGVLFKSLDNPLKVLTSKNAKLIYTIGECIAKVHNKPFYIHKYEDKYTLCFQTTAANKRVGFFQDNYLWFPIIDVVKEEGYNDFVYNMEVEDDNSYTVNNVIVHNCQDFSTAGKQRGAVFTCNSCSKEYNPLLLKASDRNTCPHCGSEDITKTRSSLVMESLRVIRHKRPKYLLMENVKGLIDKKHKSDFLRIIDEINSYGYDTYWSVLNAKDFEVPQNRERVFLVGIRKDLKKEFKFPEPIKNDVILRDILEDEVDKKYYFKDDVQERFIFAPKKNLSVVGTTKPKTSTSFGQRYLVYNPCSYIGTLTATDYKQPKQIIVPKKEILPIANVSRSGYSNGNVYAINGISPTIMEHHGVGVRIFDINNFLIRKLTPKETFRCMSFSDEDYENVKKIGISDTQMYKQTGNSIVVKVLEAIFKELIL